MADYLESIKDNGKNNLSNYTGWAGLTNRWTRDDTNHFYLFIRSHYKVYVKSGSIPTVTLTLTYLKLRRNFKNGVTACLLTLRTLRTDITAFLLRLKKTITVDEISWIPSGYPYRIPGFIIVFNIYKKCISI